MKRFRRHIFVFDLIFVFILIALVTLYGHLIGFYTTHSLFIVFIFVIIITALIYVYDVIRKNLHNRVKGLQIAITKLDTESLLPKTIEINEVRKKNHQLVYRFQGYNIPITFVERVDQEKAYLYPYLHENENISKQYEIIENYKFEYFLVKDNNQKKFIVNRTQVLSIE